MSLTVTAICLTRRRRDWLPQAIGHFQAQDYLNRRMLILADTREDVDGLVPNDPTIHVETLEALHRPCRTIGAKRNLGCSLIETDLVASWDDDDAYAPHHLSQQIGRLVESGKAMNGYHSAKMHSPTGIKGNHWWKYHGTPQFSLGASLLFTREYWQKNQFREFQIGEDSDYVSEAWRQRQLATHDGAADLLPQRSAGDSMIVNMHEGNTSPKKVCGNWQVLG